MPLYKANPARAAAGEHGEALILPIPKLMEELREDVCHYLDYSLFFDLTYSRLPLIR